jgi:hypothetical protein
METCFAFSEALGIVRQNTNASNAASKPKKRDHKKEEEEHVQTNWVTADQAAVRGDPEYVPPPEKQPWVDGFTGQLCDNDPFANTFFRRTVPMRRKDTWRVFPHTYWLTQHVDLDLHLDLHVATSRDLLIAKYAWGDM